MKGTTALAASPWTAALLVVGACAATFAGCLEVGLLADDFALLGAVRDGVGWSGPLPVGSGFYYRPLVVASLSAGGVALQHGVSLLLHAAAALLLLAVARRAGAPPLPALLLALLFATHPLVVTPVVWLAARGDLLCTVLVLAAVLAFLRFLGGGGRWLPAAAGAAVVAAPLAKETGLVLAPVLAVVWLLARRGSLGRRMAVARIGPAGRAVAAYGVLAAAVGALLTLLVWRHAPGTLWSGPAGPAGVLLVALNAVVLRLDEFDLRRWAYASPWLRPAGTAVAVLVVAASAAAVARLRGRRALLDLVLLTALPLLPLVPLMALGWARERQIYLSWALLVTALALVAGRLRHQERLAGACFGLVPLLLWGSLAGGAVWRHNAAYLESACATFRRAVAEGPDDRPLVLVTWPFSRGEVPLYSNDPHETLHHCLHGTFGRLERLQPYGALVLGDAGAAPHRAVAGGDADGALLRRVTSDRAYFRLGRGHRPGDVLEGPSARLTVTEVDRSGDVAAFRLTLDREPPPLLLDLGPGGFRRLGEPASRP